MTMKIKLQSPALLQFYIIVGLAVLGCISIVGYFFIERSAFWDNRFLYSFFHDNLQSLNYFGEPAWWFPHNQLGIPGYFYSILGDMNCSSPIFITLATIFWLLGKAGIYITNILPVYIWYFGIIIPFLFSLSVWLFARQILKSNIAIIFVCIIAVFSPGLILNLTDTGFLEIAAYGLFFCAAYLNFIKKPEIKSFLALVLSIAVLAVTLNFTFFMWNCLFLPIFLLLTLFPKDSFNQVSTAIRSVSLKYWIMAIVLVLLCLLLPLITLSQRGEIVKRTIGDSVRYDVRSLFSLGSPLEVLLSATPGVGPFWTYVEKRCLVLVPTFLRDARISYVYLGLLALPLAIWGFIYNRSYWRVRFFVLFGIFFSVVILSNYSPLLLTLLVLPTPLQSMCHFADGTYRAGGFVLLILAAGLGLDFLQEKRPENRFFIILFVFSVLISATILFFIDHVSKSVYIVIFSLVVFLGIIFSILLLWLTNQNNSNNNVDKRLIFGLILFFTLIDVSSIAHLHVKKVMVSNLQQEKKLSGDVAYSDLQNPDHIGVVSREANNQADTDLTTKSLLDLRREGFPLEQLPVYSLFARAHIPKTFSREDFDNILKSRSLALSEDALKSPEAKGNDFNELLKAGFEEENTLLGQYILQKKTYSSLYFKVNTSKPALLFVRDGYNPYWKAKVNGNNATVFRAFGHFKAVIVPKGESEVIFKFRPQGILPSLFLAYLSILFIFVLWLREFLLTRNS